MLRTIQFLLLALVVTSSAAHAQRTYEVSITNITRGQTFTPQLVLSHDREAALFTLGQPASLGLEELAEGGSTAVLGDEVAAVTRDSTTIDGLLGPGETTSTEIVAQPQQDVLSVAAMLIPTNDTFMALDGVALPRNRVPAVYYAAAYDAGTEVNDQDCASIPGPRCGGEGFNPDRPVDQEGYVYIGGGFHSLDGPAEVEILGPAVYDWRNPVARITVTRVR